eukprot:GFKZ01001185.1.p1 GENE.GFKZ01001185.1~~GFKZ01001185.1.p1  ORF type:complete len:326 (-),score=48.59 GFKZ01001185.1:684-1598(-)
MTAELHRLANDPNFVVEFAVGDPAPQLVPQSRDVGLRMSSVYFDTPKRYVLKSAHMSREDIRIFDTDTGRVVLVSHHPGKNPYEAFDPLGMGDSGRRYEVAGGEWESVCDVTSRDSRFQSFKIRPKKLSRHGRQYVKFGDHVVMNVGKVGKFKTMSLRDQFMVGEGDDGDAVLTCVADMLGRSVMIRNDKDHLVAQMAKTSKALMLTAAFGSGSESTIDIAPGVDCSVILAAVFAMRQVGAHFMSDVFNNYLMDPAKDAVMDSAVDAAGMGDVVDQYNQLSGDVMNQAGALTRAARFINDNFFQ